MTIAQNHHFFQKGFCVSIHYPAFPKRVGVVITDPPLSINRACGPTHTALTLHISY
ncbi:hypothetical protein J2Z37_001445, partial [Ammoniphilus resinae]|nr:hypothetical protein [Ammoniphilus resinae]